MLVFVLFSRCLWFSSGVVDEVGEGVMKGVIFVVVVVGVTVLSDGAMVVVVGMVKVVVVSGSLLVWRVFGGRVVWFGGGE